MAITWTGAQDSALKMHVLRGQYSFAEIASVINKEFGTAYSRNACIGRSTRKGYSGPARPKPVSKERTVRIRKPRERRPKDDKHRAVFKIVANGHGYRNFQSSEAVSIAKLRCVEVDPRLLTFAQLEENDCRYPYGDGDASELRFCGHPQFVYERAGLTVTSSYCGPHYGLTTGQGTVSERIATHGVAA